MKEEKTSEFTYTVVEPNEESLLATIEKGGIKGRFTIKDVRVHQIYLKKLMKELEGKRLVEDAKATNIMAHNKFLGDLTEEQIHAAHLYFESMAFIAEADKKAVEVGQQIEDYEAEVQRISEATGLTFPEVDLPEAAPVAEEEECQSEFITDGASEVTPEN